jgi:hypothetical protein
LPAITKRWDFFAPPPPPPPPPGVLLLRFSPLYLSLSLSDHLQSFFFPRVSTTTKSARTTLSSDLMLSETAHHEDSGLLLFLQHLAQRQRITQPHRQPHKHAKHLPRQESLNSTYKPREHKQMTPQLPPTTIAINVVCGSPNVSSPANIGNRSFKIVVWFGVVPGWLTCNTS